jgi:hypothetical protein
LERIAMRVGAQRNVVENGKLRKPKPGEFLCEAEDVTLMPMAWPHLPSLKFEVPKEFLREAARAAARICATPPDTFRDALCAALHFGRDATDEQLLGTAQKLWQGENERANTEHDKRESWKREYMRMSRLHEMSLHELYTARHERDEALRDAEAMALEMRRAKR